MISFKHTKITWQIAAVLLILAVVSPVSWIEAQSNTNIQHSSLTKNERVIEEPDLTALVNIEGDYFTSCQSLSGKDEDYTDFQRNLKTVNIKTFEIVKDLADQNKLIRKAVLDISKALAKINNSVIAVDIRRTKKRVLKEMEALKRQLKETRKSIEKIKTMVDQSQKSVGNTYCQVDQYVSLYLLRVEESLEHQMEARAQYDTSTAAQMSAKRFKLYKVMVEFDHYFGLLDTLFLQAQHKLLLLDSVQKNIVSFVDTHCRVRTAPCRYQQQADLRFNEVQLADIMAKIEAAFERLILTAQANFSGEKLDKTGDNHETEKTVHHSMQ